MKKTIIALLVLILTLISTQNVLAQDTDNRMKAEEIFDILEDVYLDDMPKMKSCYIGKEMMEANIIYNENEDIKISEKVVMIGEVEYTKGESVLGKLGYSIDDVREIYHGDIIKIKYIGEDNPKNYFVIETKVLGNDFREEVVNHCKKQNNIFRKFWNWIKNIF